jgi:hypothetical protein
VTVITRVFQIHPENTPKPHNNQQIPEAKSFPNGQNQERGVGTQFTVMRGPHDITTSRAFAAHETPANVHRPL